MAALGRSGGRSVARKYETSHPWLAFELDLSQAGYRLWMALGEASSKCEQIARLPLPADLQQELHRLFLAKGMWATTAIEGNTLSEEEVQQRIAGRLKLPPSKEYLGIEVDNVLEVANEILARTARGENLSLEVADLKRYNSIVLRHLELEAGVVPGEIRRHGVAVGNYLAVPPEDCEYLLGRLCDWLNREGRWIPDDPIATGILKAILAHLYIAWIHPFGDGNGRTARLVEYQILVAAGVPSPAAHLLSNHYNHTRREYYRELDGASKARHVVPFLTYAVRGFVDGLKEHLARIHALQMKIMWRDYLRWHFLEKKSGPDQRCHELIEDLSTKTEPVPLDRIPNISPRIAKAYAGKTSRTVRRDMERLIGMGLVERAKGGYRARTENLLAFLPVRAGSDEESPPTA